MVWFKSFDFNFKNEEEWEKEKKKHLFILLDEWLMF